MSAKSLVSAVKGGDIQLYSEKYNLLPAQTKTQLEALIKEEDARNVSEKTDFSKPEFNIDMDFQNIMQGLFSSNTAQKIEDMRNDNRLVPLTQDFNRKQAEIEKLDIEMIGLERKIMQEQQGRLSNSSIQAMIRDRNQAYQLDKIEKLSELRIIQGDIASVQADIDRDIRLLQYEDEQNKQKYSFLYEEYKTRRGEALTMQARAEDREFTVQMAEFEAMNRELAEERQRAFTMEMTKIDQEFQKSNVKPQYMTDRNGNLIAVIDGKAQNVMNSNGEVVAITREQDYTDTVMMYPEL
jgi:hypothetical protein